MNNLPEESIVYLLLMLGAGIAFVGLGYTMFAVIAGVK